MTRTAVVAFGAWLLVVAAVAAEPSAVPVSELKAGVGQVDITPTGPVVLAGSPTTLQSTAVDTRLYARALVLAIGEQRVAIVTLDTLKYPVEHVDRARQEIEKLTGIPAAHVIISASHTHSGPLWSYYSDQLVTPIAKAVSLAASDLSHCTLGISRGGVTGVNECRRVLKDGEAWNRWQLPPDEAKNSPPEGEADSSVEVLAVIGDDNHYKAVLYNFACHAADHVELTVSADYPGAVERTVVAKLGYPVPLLFLPGACGDINPVYGVRRGLLGEKIGQELVRCLGQLEPIAQPDMRVDARELVMPARENPEFRGDDVARKWPKQFEHYRKNFEEMQRQAQPTYRFLLTGISIGPDFAIVTNPTELFCDIGVSIKRQSPFRHTMVAEQTNGAHGYVPTAKAFSGGSYETWFGEHSYLSTRAGAIIDQESLQALTGLHRAK